MVNFHINSPSAVIAEYKEQQLPQFKNNPLIQALPQPLSDIELFDAMAQLPEFDETQRAWPDADRIQMTLTLSNFMVPSPRHIRLGRTLDSMIRAGYVGRAPRTLEHAQRLQNTYDTPAGKRPGPLTILKNNPQLSTLLMGMPGMGKTTSVRRLFSNYSQVIYHPDHSIYQVTYLHVEMPSDGASIKALAYGILHELDKLIPGANYYLTYSNLKQSADVLMRGVARLLHQHFVGFLIADEIQNLTNANSGKSKQTVMTELVSACNDLGVPILFVGTNKAAQVFSMDFRTSRRASGHGIEQWERLSEACKEHEEGKANARSEWHEFLDVLWTFQWVRKPVELEAHFLATMYHLSQGIIDVAIKLFASAQAHAISDHSEELTPELLVRIYEEEFSLLHPMLQALREGKTRDISQYSDIAPVGKNELVNSAFRKVNSQAFDTPTVQSADRFVASNIAITLEADGHDGSKADEAAQFALQAGKARNLNDDVGHAPTGLKTSAPTRRIRSRAEPPVGERNAESTFAAEDYRSDIAAAATGGRKVYEQLKRSGKAVPLETILDLS